MSREAPAEAPSWVATLREAADGRAHVGVEVSRGTPPGWLAPDSVHAVMSAMIAALVIAAAVLRTQLTQSAPFDLFALLLRTASIAFGARALFALGRTVLRIVRDRRAPRHLLAWSHEGLYLRAPDGERWLAREDLLGFVARSERTVRAAPVSLAPLFVVARPADALTFLTLPPYFAPRAELLAARLSRTLAAPRAGVHAQRPPPESLEAEARYARAARGQRLPGELAVPEGTGYRLRAPYGVLLALVFIADALLRAGALRERIWPAALLAGALAPCALFTWFGWVRRRRRARLGIALLLAPEELLVRGSHGVLSIPWSQLAGVEVRTSLSWSPFVGSYVVRVLALDTREGASIPFDGAFLGVPPEVLACVLEGYRAGMLASASQGSGGGGGSSGIEGETASATSETGPSRSIDSGAATDVCGRSSET